MNRFSVFCADSAPVKMQIKSTNLLQIIVNNNNYSEKQKEMIMLVWMKVSNKTYNTSLIHLNNPLRGVYSLNITYNNVSIHFRYFKGLLWVVPS